MVEVSELQKATNQLAQRLLKSGPKESRTIEYMLLGPRSRDIHNQKGFSKQHKCRLHVEKDEWDLAIRKSQFYLTLSFFYNMSDSIRQTRFVNPIVLQHAHVFQDFPVLITCNLARSNQYFQNTPGMLICVQEHTLKVRLPSP